MGRRHQEEEHENHERWLVSYADFITLLFAFFVVMYAISSINEGKYRVLSDALGSAFGRSPVPSTILNPQAQQTSPLRPRSNGINRNNDPAFRREREQMTTMARDILKALAPLVRQGKVKVTQSARGINVEISASVLFASGDARLNPESEQALRAVAAVLRNDKHAIQVEGHTDNQPINTLAFPSNWELSAVRASSVVRVFLDSGVNENRMIAVGHGSNQAVASNETVEGRARNRRVEIVILSGLPEVVTEVPVEPGT